MATSTTNLNLIKPEKTDNTIVRETYNTNLDTIDGRFSSDYLAIQSKNSVNITGGSITGITDLAVADGGTGASDAAGARANLGLVIGTDVAACGANSDITSLTGLTTPLGAAYGGTGVANDPANTITFTGAYSLSLTLSGNTNITLPTSGTLETDTHASDHAVGGADTVFPADPGADRYLMWDDDPGELVWAEGGGGGATTFTGLTDTPTDYTGNGGKLVKVNTGATALEFGQYDIVNDTTPELGGELDCGAHSIGFTLQTATGDGTTTIDWKLGNKFKFTFGSQNETFTFTAPSNPCNLLLMLVQDSTGGRTATWPSGVKWPGGTAPTLSTGANAVDIISFWYDGTSYYGVASLNFSS